jgi:hypothetical protein
VPNSEADQTSTFFDETNASFDPNQSSEFDFATHIQEDLKKIDSKK